MRYLLLLLTVASIALFALVGSGAADPNLVNAPPHQHFLVANGVWHPIGPQVCPAGTNLQLQRAFNQFHFNIHHSELPGNPPTVVDTLGPQLGAPGLHNDIGADMEGRPCSFVPPAP
jgi:hypothetical protein